MPGQMTSSGRIPVQPSLCGMPTVQKCAAPMGAGDPARHQEESTMGAWRPPKKRTVDVIENALAVLALWSMGMILLIITIVVA